MSSANGAAAGDGVGDGPPPRKTVRVRRTKLVRVVLTPRIVGSTTRRVRYGHGTTVSGWLGTAPSGIALGGQSVRVLTAPDNGLGQFSQRRS